MIKEGVYLAKRYEILERIGSGGMADVYKGKDHKLNRFVAIKVLKSDYRSDEVFIKKFVSEAQAAAGLMHPNVVNVYDVGQDRGLYYMVMELVEGITLKDYIEKKGKLSAKETISISIQMVSGLQAAHNYHIIHRDIKPQNIMISRDGKVKVTDFGIARATTSTQTISTSVMGSVHYTSPEQARGGIVDEKSDIYSVGITMYEMITGHVPFDGDSTVSVALKHLQEQITRPSEEVPDIPYSLECIIMKCTQKNPEMRYHDCASLLTDLKHSLVDPDGDFVMSGILPGRNTDRTVVMSTEELNKIQNKRYQNDDDYDEDEDDEDYDDGDADDYDENEDEEDNYERRPSGDSRRRKKNDVNPDTKKIMKILMIVAGVIIALLVLFLVANAAGFFSNGSGIVQKEEAKVKVPDLRGMTLEEAKEELKGTGLGIREENEKKASSKYGEGEIMEQDPESGEKVDKHTTIKVTISSGEEPQMTTVPNVVNQPEDQAEKMIRDANLVVKHGQSQNSDTVEEGCVISCSPNVGEEIEEGETVTIIVSLGKNEATVPNLVDKSASDAEAALSKAGLTGNPTEDYDDSVPKGYVISQGIDAGTSVESGTSVDYVVSLGPDTEYVTVPSLSNCDEQTARQRLTDEGLVASVDYAYSSSVRQGYVISQTAGAGSSVEAGTTIGFTVSKGPEPQSQPPVTDSSDGSSSSGGDSGNESESSGSDTESGTDSNGSGEDTSSDSQETTPDGNS